jgi:hypothetical protein
MNIDKAKKRISKLVKKGFKGYPLIEITYYVENNSETAHEVVVSFIIEEGAEPQTQKLSSKNDARHDETIQSTLVKIIERTQAVTVNESVSVLS